MRILRPICAGVFVLPSALGGGCAPGGLGTAPAAGPVAFSALHPGSHRAAGVSWTVPDATSHDLLYVTNANGLVSVYRYWKPHTLVGVLYNFTSPMGECADKAGNVYITDYAAETIAEYAHGGTKPIRTIDDSPYQPYGCALDPKTGNLAVANYEKNGYYYNNDTGNIAIYAQAKGTPTYWGSNDGRFTSLTYDDHGDLLATARSYYYYSFFYTTIFYYLPDKATQLLSMNLPNTNFTYYYWPTVQSMNYDGQYWVVTTYDDLYRYTIDVKAQEADELVLTGGNSQVGEIAFYRKKPKAMATQVVGGGEGFETGKSFVGYWKYPSVGNPYYQITTYLDGPFGIAISLK